MRQLFEITPETGATLTADGKTCNYLCFLENVSSTEKELMSKLCAIGYLLYEPKELKCARAVVAMDENQGLGRTGKSIMCMFLQNFRQTVFFPGRKMVENNQFRSVDINYHTNLVLIEDLPPGFDFSGLFPCITGDWPTVRKDGSARIVPFVESPKIFITSNHPIAGSGLSYTLRQWRIWFSDYYRKLSPFDEFNRLFIDEWNNRQWILTWHLAAQCVEAYLKFGYCEAIREGGES